MNRAERGKELFEAGMNCSQAVLLAYEDELGVDRSVLLRIGSSFGGGMGRLREVCGAVSGIFAVAGLLQGPEDPTDHKAKTAHYKLIQELAAKFREKNGFIVCRELLGLRADENSHVPEERTEEYYRRRPCAKYIMCAIEILEEQMNV